MSDAIPPAPSPAEPPNAPGPAYAQPGPGWIPAPPSEPRATTALILGIVAFAGGVMCYVPLLCGPVALVMGRKSLNAIKQQPHLGGRSEAMAGFILGLLATLMLAVIVTLIGVLIWVAVAHPEFFDE